MRLAYADVEAALRQPAPAVNDAQRDVGKGEYILVVCDVAESFLFDRSAPVAFYGEVTGSDGLYITVSMRSALIESRRAPNKSKSARIHRGWVARVLTEGEYRRAAAMGWPSPKRFLRALRATP